MGPLNQFDSESLGLLDEADFVRTAGLKGLFSIIDDRSDIVTNRKGSNGISDHKVPLSLEFLDVLFPLQNEVGHGVFRVLHVHGNVLGDVGDALFVELYDIVKGQPFENHLVLGQSSGLVREKELYSPQFLGDLTVSGLSAFDLFVFVDSVAIDKFCEVQIHPHADGNDAAQEDKVSEKIFEEVLKIWSVTELLDPEGESQHNHKEE